MAQAAVIQNKAALHNMTTVAQFIAHLQTLPQDAIVQCLVEKSRGYETYTTWEDVEIDKHVYLCDKWLEIGEK